MNNKLKITLALLFSIVLGGTAYANGNRTATSGVIVCGGNQLIRNGGTEFHQTNYIFRNYDESIAINIERIRVYNASGLLLHDYPGSALPGFTNGVLGPMDNSLESFQSAQLSSQEFFGNSGLNAAERHKI